MVRDIAPGATFMKVVFRKLSKTEGLIKLLKSKAASASDDG